MGSEEQVVEAGLGIVDAPIKLITKQKITPAMH